MIGAAIPIRSGAVLIHQEEKQHVHVARKPKKVYKIRCDGPPTMKSIALELGD